MIARRGRLPRSGQHCIRDGRVVPPVPAGRAALGGHRRRARGSARAVHARLRRQRRVALSPRHDQRSSTRRTWRCARRLDSKRGRPAERFTALSAVAHAITVARQRAAVTRPMSDLVVMTRRRWSRPARPSRRPGASSGTACSARRFALRRARPRGHGLIDAAYLADATGVSDMY